MNEAITLSIHSTSVSGDTITVKGVRRSDDHVVQYTFKKNLLSEYLAASGGSVKSLNLLSDKHYLQGEITLNVDKRTNQTVSVIGGGWRVVESSPPKTESKASSKKQSSSVRGIARLPWERLGPPIPPLTKYAPEPFDITKLTESRAFKPSKSPVKSSSSDQTKVPPLSTDVPAAIVEEQKEEKKPANPVIQSSDDKPKTKEDQAYTYDESYGILPTKLPVWMSDPDETRLGYTVINAPITSFMSTKKSLINESPAMRSLGGFKQPGSSTYESFTITIKAAGPDQIHNSILQVLEQINLHPILCVEGGLFPHSEFEQQSNYKNRPIPYNELVVRSFSLTTLPESPGGYQLDLQVDPFIWTCWAPMSGESAVTNNDESKHEIINLGDGISWPIYKIWCKNAARSRYTGNKRVTLTLPDRNQISDLTNLISFDSAEDTGSDTATLETLARLVSNENNWEESIKPGYKPEVGREAVKQKINVTSDNVKRLPTFNDNAQTFIVKINNKQNFYRVWKELGKFTAGLSEWSPYNWSLGGSEGERISEQVDIASVLTPNSYGTRYQAAIADVVIDQADVNPVTPEGVRETSLLSQAIEDYFIQKEYNRLEPSISLANPASAVLAQATENVKATVNAAKANPQDFFGFVIDADAYKLKELLYSINDLVNKGEDKGLYSEISLGSDSYNTSINRIFSNNPDPDTGHFLDISEEPHFVISSISANGGWNIAVVNVDSTALPLHQCMGATSKTLVIQGIASEAGKQRLNLLYNKFIDRAIGKKAEGYDGRKNPKTDYDFRRSTVSPTLIKIESEFTSLLGIDFVMPLGLDFQTIPGVPDNYTFVLSLIDFDPRSKLAEQLKTLNTFNQANTNTLKYNDALRSEGDPYPTWLKAVDWASLQGALKNEELLPDLFLPTKDMLRSWVAAIQALGKDPNSSNPNHQIIKNWLWEFFIDKYSYESFQYYDPKFRNETSGKYVDPDFYMYYNDDGWKSYIDLMCRVQLGERDGMSGNPKTILQAEDPGSANSAFRLRETFDGQEESVTITSLISPAQLTGHSDRLMLHLNERFNNAYNSDGSLATDLLASRDEALATTKEVGKQLGWWIGDGEMRDNIVSWGKSEELTKLMNLGGLPSQEFDNVLIPLEDAGDRERVENTPDASPEGNANIKRFFSVGFRLKAIRKALISSIDFSGLTVGELTTHPQTFMLNVENRATNTFEILSGNTDEVLSNISESAVFLKPNQIKSKGINKTLWTPDEYLNEIVKGPHSKPESDKILSPFGGFRSTRDLNLFNKIAYYNWYLSKQARGAAAIAKEISNNSEEDFGETQMKDVISEAIRVNVPPSILFAFFNARTGFGKIKPTGDGGWGDLDLARLNTPTTPVGTDSISAINVFGEYWNKAKSLYKSNTVRMLYCHIMLTKVFHTYGANKEKYDKLLKDADTATTVANHLTALRTLTIGLGNAYPLDAYYDSWLSWARSGGLENASNGGEIQTTNDIFFTVNNPYLAIDIGNMANSEKHLFGNTTARSLETDFTPSGQKTYVNLDRGRTGLNALRKMGNLEDTNFSLEQQGKILLKQRYALFPSSTEALYGMLIDMRNFSGVGRLKAFYPTFFMAIINEGFYWKGGVEKLWDHYYTRTAVSNIELVSSIETPTSICTITLSNVFRSLQRYKAETVFLEEQALEEHNTALANVFNPGKIAYELFNRQLLKKFDNTLRGIWERNYLNTFVLKPGARIHLRMGYGSNAAMLPTVFNGTVSEVPVGDDTVTLVAYSDGEELNKQIAVGNTQTNNGWVWKNSGGVFGRGKSPANIVTESLIQVDGWKSIVSERLNPIPGLMTRDMSHGIAHFGDLYMDGLRFFPAELTVNIYDSSPVLDQSPDSDFYNNYGTYDWNAKKTYFSVAVNEATPYKVLDVCRRAVSDFVGFPSYFGTESRVFYGKWWWPAHHSYSGETITAFAPSVTALTGKADINVTKRKIILDFPYFKEDPRAAGESLSPSQTEKLKMLQDEFASGKISHLTIADGDTVSVKNHTSFRFNKVDAPESDQPYGPESRETLRKILMTDGSILITVTGVDAYGRFLIDIKVGDLSSNDVIDVQEEMLKAGMASLAYIPEVDKDTSTIYKKPAPSWTELENEAKTNKIGLWADEKVIHPRVWRRGGKFLLSPGQGPKTTTPQPNPLLNGLSVGIATVFSPVFGPFTLFTTPYNVEDGFWENAGRRAGNAADMGLLGGLTSIAGGPLLGPLAAYIAQYIPKEFQSSFATTGSRVGALMDSTKSGSELADGSDPTSAYRDVEYLVQTLNWKPFTQVFFVQSGLNLIQNSIKADASKVYTDAVGVQTYNGVFSSDSIERTISYSVDDDIIPASRKTLSVDSGLYLTYASVDAGDGVKRALGVVPGLNTLINRTPTTPMVYNSVINTLADHVGFMYGGWLTIKGLPTMKPRDLIYLECTKTGLTGPIRAKSIIHRLDLQNGLVTFVSPMAVTVPAGSSHTTSILMALQALAGKITAYTAFRTIILPLTVFGLLGRGMKKASVNQAGDILYSEYRMRQLQTIFQGTSLDFITQADEDLINDLFKVELASQPGTKKNPAVEYNSTREMLEARKKIAAERESLLDEIERNEKPISKKTKKRIKDLELDEKQLTKNLEEIKKEYARTLEAKYNFEKAKPSPNLDDIKKFEEELKMVKEWDFDKPEVAHILNKADLLKMMANNNPDVSGFRKTISDKLTEAGKKIGMLDEDLKKIFDLDKTTGEVIEDFDEKYYEKIRSKLIDEGISPDDIVRRVRHEKAKLLEAIFDEIESDPNIARFLADNVDEGEIRSFIRELASTEKVWSAADEEILTKALRAAGKTDAKSFRNLIKQLTWSINDTTLKDPKPFRFWDHANPFHPFNKIKEARRMRKLRSAGATTSNALLSGTNRVMEFFDKGVKESWKAKNFNAIKEFFNGKKTLNAAKATGRTTATAFRVGMLLGPQIMIGIAKEVAMVMLGDSIVCGINERLRARQCVKIYPLFVGKTPYTAGIIGHAGAVVGDEPGWFDNVLFNSPMSGAIQLAAGFLGVEFPDANPSDEDKEYRQSQGEQETNTTVEPLN